MDHRPSAIKLFKKFMNLISSGTPNITYGQIADLIGATGGSRALNTKYPLGLIKLAVHNNQTIYHEDNKIIPAIQFMAVRGRDRLASVGASWRNDNNFENIFDRKRQSDILAAVMVYKWSSQVQSDIIKSIENGPKIMNAGHLVGLGRPYF